jgi:nitric oxide synthase oxygenase domain/subunit
MQDVIGTSIDVLDIVVRAERSEFGWIGRTQELNVLPSILKTSTTIEKLPRMLRTAADISHHHHQEWAIAKGPGTGGDNLERPC